MNRSSVFKNVTLFILFQKYNIVFTKKKKKKKHKKPSAKITHPSSLHLDQVPSAREVQSYIEATQHL